MKQAKYVDMCSGPILRKMIVFTLPIMFSGLFQLLFNATDIIVVGRFAGDNALAAVGSNTALINLMTNTQICPDCGTREALESIGVSADEQEKIISIIHNKTHSSDR